MGRHAERIRKRYIAAERAQLEKELDEISGEPDICLRELYSSWLCWEIRELPTRSLEYFLNAL